jgi:hypothetical protein
LGFGLVFGFFGFLGFGLDLVFGFLGLGFGLGLDLVFVFFGVWISTQTQKTQKNKY